MRPRHRKPILPSFPIILLTISFPIHLPSTSQTFLLLLVSHLSLILPSYPNSPFLEKTKELTVMQTKFVHLPVHSSSPLALTFFSSHFYFAPPAIESSSLSLLMAEMTLLCGTTMRSPRKNFKLECFTFDCFYTSCRVPTIFPAPARRDPGTDSIVCKFCEDDACVLYNIEQQLFV